ncbi:hypothetical protein [Embleya sp. MST-111070]|uniref:hypothetical protein n=1 Tax=Embleya sp. MST-111070 TaxID=3398231 RepID=UPI003F735086
MIASELTPYSRPNATPYSTPVAGGRPGSRARRPAAAYSHADPTRAGRHTARSRPTGAWSPTVSEDRSEPTTIASATRTASTPARSRAEGRSPSTTDDNTSSSTRPATRMPCAAASGRAR